jgi:hypothetical protein
MTKRLFFFLLLVLPSIGFAQSYSIGISANANNLYSTNNNFRYNTKPGCGVWLSAELGPHTKYSRLSLRLKLGVQQLSYQADVSPFSVPATRLTHGSLQVLPTLKLKGGRSFSFGVGAQSPFKKANALVLDRKAVHFEGILGLTQAIYRFDLGLSAHHGITPFQIESPGFPTARKQYHRYLVLSLGYRF